MKKKILGIFVCILLIAVSISSVTGAIDENEIYNMKNDDYNNLIKQVIKSGIISTDDWLEQDKLLASDGAAGDLFGCSVSIDGDYSIIGADEDMDDLEANISGSTTFNIGSPDDMTIIVTGMPDGVVVNAEPGHSCCWVNVSTDIDIMIYGGDQDDKMNASIEITGCGLDIFADEEDAEYQTGWGAYTIPISPKTSGTVTITATNDTENLSASKDFSVKGLYGSVTTSVGDDLEISVGTTEIIIATISSGQYAEVRLCKFDEDWDYEDCVNDTIGDGTAGNGLNGVFEFSPDEDFLENVGYLVLAANANVYYMYDIVEIVPAPDLDCDGELSWTDVTPGSTVTGSFTVENIGDPELLLDWEVESYPEWGTWTFDPESGTDLLAGETEIIDVEVVAPDEPKETFTGAVILVNSNYPGDTCIIDVSLATPVNQHVYSFPILQMILERFPNAFPILRHLMGL